MRFPQSTKKKIARFALLQFCAVGRERDARAAGSTAALLVCALLMAPSLLHAAGDLHAIGVSVANAANPFYLQVAKGAATAAREIQADAKVTVLGGAYDLSKQTGHIDDFINRKVDMIVLAAVDSEAIGPAVQRARNAGIIVVAVDVTAKNANLAVTTDNVHAGAMACAYLADRLHGKGNVVILNGPPVSSIHDRVKGCRQVLAEHADIRILTDNQDAKGSIEGGQKVMTDVLTAQPKIDAVFAINDPTAIGAELAAKQARRSEFFITAVDGAPMAEKALTDPKGLFAATASQDPYALGYTAVQLGAKALRGEAIEPLTLVEAKMVTRETIDQYRGWESH
jgi:ribose transport system substrate-binding protein